MNDLIKSIIVTVVSVFVANILWDQFKRSSLRDSLNVVSFERRT